MTPLQAIYDSFLSKMLDDEWSSWAEVEVNKDLEQLLVGAIAHFKFPRVDLTIEGDHFVGELDVNEVQILANFMRCEWIDRTILTWENIKSLYSERDFSQANLLDKLKAISENEWKKAEKLESNYYRSIKGKPYDYSRLAGGTPLPQKVEKTKKCISVDDEITIDAGGAEYDE
jgi:hypothetical protein